MRADVIANVNEAGSDDFMRKTVIVIDVLRATSTIVTALAHGASAIVPVETVSQAKRLHEPGDLLGGERFCKEIAGFHLGNSPLEYATPDIRGKKIVLTTTNGTKAIQKSQNASCVLAGSFLNAKACAEAALGMKRDVVIVCAGTQDEFSLEDGLAAGLLIREMTRLNGEPPDVNDFGAAMRLAYESAAHRLKKTLLDSANGRRLVRLGFQEDVAFCAEVDRYDLVPVLKGQEMGRF